MPVHITCACGSRFFVPLQALNDNGTFAPSTKPTAYCVGCQAVWQWTRGEGWDRKIAVGSLAALRLLSQS